MSTATDLWTELIADSFMEHGIEASIEQINAVAVDCQMYRENEGMMSYNPGSSHLLREIDDLKKQVAAEREKVTCRTCGGRGTVIHGDAVRSSESQCWKCRGEGKVTT